MEFLRLRNTVLSNPGGVLDSVLSFGLSHRLEANTRMYFYKFNFYDLVEIKLESDRFVVYDFSHTGERAMDLKNSLDFLEGYFNSAGLQGKRFLYDLTTKLPVSYNDFIEYKDLPRVDSGYFPFVLDKKEGYISNIGAVDVFCTTEKCPSTDRALIAFMNNAINIKDPKKGLDLNGCVLAISTAAVLAGVKLSSLVADLSFVEPDLKYVSTLRALKFNSESVEEKVRGLKVDKFLRIVNSKKKEKDNPTIEGKVEGTRLGENEVSLREIIDTGLDNFIKSLKPDRGYKVIVDTEWQQVRSAYILGGVMFITPYTLVHLNHFKELLDSDNIEYVLS